MSAKLSVNHAARMLGVSPSTLRAWANEGRIEYERTSGGHRLFDVAVIAAEKARRIRKTQKVQSA